MRNILAFLFLFVKALGCTFMQSAGSSDDLIQYENAAKNSGKRRWKCQYATYSIKHQIPVIPPCITSTVVSFTQLFNKFVVSTFWALYEVVFMNLDLLHCTIFFLIDWNI